MAKKEGFNLDEIERRLRAGKPKLMVDLEAVSERFFLASWRKQGWDDGSLQRWQEVKRRIPGTRAYNSARKSSRTRSILVQSGRLRRSFYTRIRRNDIIQIANSAPYAQPHNEGTMNAGRGRRTRIPQRQFMGHSKTLEKQQVAVIKRWLNKCLDNE